jgi:hypothetical protein
MLESRIVWTKVRRRLRLYPGQIFYCPSHVNQNCFHLGIQLHDPCVTFELFLYPRLLLFISLFLLLSLYIRSMTQIIPGWFQ